MVWIPCFTTFIQVIDRILERFRPEAIVLQCGSDSLAGDKLGPFNMTHLGHSHCVQFIRSKNIPLILVGGGGYTVKNASRAWAYETACALGMEKDIDPALPWNDYFEWFGPRYRLEVLPTNAVDENTEKHVEYVMWVTFFIFNCPVSVALPLCIDHKRSLSSRLVSLVSKVSMLMFEFLCVHSEKRYLIP